MLMFFSIMCYLVLNGNYRFNIGLGPYSEVGCAGLGWLGLGS